MFKLFFAVGDIVFAVFCDNKFCQITYIANKSQSDFFTCPWRAIKLFFLLFISLTYLYGSFYYFSKFHYLSSNPNTTGNNCFFLETTPAASRVPSLSGG